jgi:uncharacterized membrane protein YgdD (TMEM256/DUF423 family)
MRRFLFTLAALAGLLGATGLAAAAAAAHLGGGQLLDRAATFLMIHSVAVLGIAALGQRAGRRPAYIFGSAGLLLIGGMVLFCGDLATRVLASRPLFPMAAPSGGILLIAGWLAAGLAAALAAPEGAAASRQA